MLCFSDSIAISYVLLLVPDRQKQVTEQWNILDLSRIFEFWNVVILIDQLLGLAMLNIQRGGCTYSLLWAFDAYSKIGATTKILAHWLNIDQIDLKLIVKN